MKLSQLLILTGILLMSCSNQNPFYGEWETPFQAPPFAEIKTEHYLPALKHGLELESTEIAAIINNPAKPDFANTIEAYEARGRFLDRVENVFWNITGTDATDELDGIDTEYSQLKASHLDDILLNDQLFQRIEQVYQEVDRNNLTVEQASLLEKIYGDFVRNGARLGKTEKQELRKINERLAILTLEFSQNVRRANQTWEMVLENSDLAGLNDRIIKAAAKTAKELDKPGKFVFTLDKPSWIPFLQNSTRRDLREKIYKGYINRCNHDDDLDNKARINEIVNLRIRKAHLLGYETWADYILERSMAKTPEQAYNLVNRLWQPALARAKRELAEYQALIDAEEGKFKLQSWDWWYYAEQVRQANYDLEEDDLRPYFAVDKVIQGAFDVANKLYGITFTPRNDIPKYYPEVKVFEVREADGTHLGLFYADYHPRSGKSVGAWSSGFRSQSNRNGNWVTPVVINVGNFTAATDDAPALLSIGEVETLFHELGHGLHSLLRNRVYTDQIMPRDFVELPSQVMENWATEPAVLKEYAHHYQTGEPIPDELIDKLAAARLHNQGFAITEYLAAAIMDLDWHTLTEVAERDPIAFENRTFDRIGLMPEIISRYRSPYYKHVFSGGYSAGYYSYIWAQVLDADAFKAFKDTDLFNQELAAKMRKYILGLSGTYDAAEIYRQFRGRDPEIEPLLRKRGLVEQEG